MKKIPYIGITDFTSREQVEAMHRVLVGCRGQHQSPRQLHAGVMMSYKTLYGIPTQWEGIFPDKDQVAEIFTPKKGVMNCLHYADYRPARAIDLHVDLVQVIRYGGAHMNALQLDMVWPSPNDIESALHECEAGVQVILQVGKDAFDRIENEPDELVRMLSFYQSVVSYVLLDRSMGRGQAMDARAFLPFMRAIRNCFPDLGIAVAGGLGPSTVDLIEPLLAEFPDVSIDAQGRLRSNGDAHDPIEWDRAETYLRKSAQLLS